MEDGQSSEIKRSPENGLGEKRERKILVGVLAGLCVIALILGVVIIARGLNSTKNGTVAETQSTENQDSKTTNAELDNYITEIERKIQNAETNEEKAKLYLEKSMKVASSCIEQCESYYKTALSDAYKAEEVSPSAESAWLISNFEMLSGGNEQNAERYRELAEERGMNIEGAG